MRLRITRATLLDLLLLVALLISLWIGCAALAAANATA